MWTNQDEMFADEESRITIQDEEVRKKAVEVLDDLAMRILEGDVRVRGIQDTINRENLGDPRTAMAMKDRELRLEYYNTEATL